MLNNLLASAGWILDLVFFLILILGIAHGAYRGFVAGICKIAGKIFALLFALFFCVSFANFLETCFHMTTGITNAIAGAITKDELYAVGLPTDVVGAEIGVALESMGIGGFRKWLITLSFSKVELIPAGTTPATLVASVYAKWISVVIAFIVLILIVRLGVLLITKIFDAIKDTVAPIRVIDQVLGAILGLVKAVLLIFILLLVCNWLPFEGLHAFISSSGIVGRIFNSNWFLNATAYAISGQWFNDYIARLLA